MAVKDTSPEALAEKAIATIEQDWLVDEKDIPVLHVGVVKLTIAALIRQERAACIKIVKDHRYMDMTGVCDHIVVDIRKRNRKPR